MRFCISSDLWYVCKVNDIMVSPEWPGLVEDDRHGKGKELIPSQHLMTAGTGPQLCAWYAPPGTNGIANKCL